MQNQQTYTPEQLKLKHKMALRRPKQHCKKALVWLQEDLPPRKKENFFVENSWQFWVCQTVKHKEK